MGKGFLMEELHICSSDYVSASGKMEGQVAVLTELHWIYG